MDEEGKVKPQREYQGFPLGDTPKISNTKRPAKVKVVEYDQSNFLAACVDKYCQLAGIKATSLRQVDTPFLDESLKMPKEEPNGKLKSIASKVLMKVLYAARMGRFDLLRPCNHLARYVTKWSTTCDRRLHRLMCYIHHSLQIKCVGWIGDSMDDLQIQIYSDADFASDKEDRISTTGVFMCLRGPNSFFPLACLSKKQGCVSHSTPEAEIIAIDTAIKNHGIPALDLWETLLKRKRMNLKVHEDNETCARICRTGKNETMRHLERTHDISVAWLHQQFKRGEFDVINEPTDGMCADIFTKAFTAKHKWLHACHLIGHVDPKRMFGRHAPAVACTIGDHAYRTYTRYKQDATNFLTTHHNGPSWRRVFRRRTYDDNTDELIAEEDVIGVPESLLHRALPHDFRGVKIRVELDFWPRGVPLTQAQQAYLTPAAPAHPTKRRILEWCCGPNSKIGSHPCTRRGCDVLRITEKEDATKPKTVEKAKAFVVQPRCLLFSSMPCTGGSPWQRINVKKPGGYANLRRHRKLFNALWTNFESIARQAHAARNYIAIEWPRGCSYWLMPKVKNLCTELGLKFVDFHGCMFGLKSVYNGKLIMKPWRIATNSPELLKGFQGHLCCGHDEHAPCAGKDTKLTENYTDSMVDLIHKCWKKQASTTCHSKSVQGSKPKSRQASTSRDSKGIPNGLCNKP